MNTGSLEVSRRPEAVPGGWALAFLLAAASACAPSEEDLEPVAPRTRPQAQALDVLNGLSLNGLSLNGLSLNGLSLNGLWLDGLSTTVFDTWFQKNPELHDTVMKYVVLCAVPQGESRTYTSPTTGQSWTWAGELGLAPDWTHGAPATLAEQRIVSACLAAHVNKYGVHIPISVMGLRATGEALPVSALERQVFSEKEACFFGNLFTAEGVYVGQDGRTLTSKESSARACALRSSKDKQTQQCPPLVRVEQDCSRLCTLDPSGKFYVSCTYNGITYPAITTRILRWSIYTCGDGICQLTEKCGTGKTYDSCKKDCGVCPEP